MKHKLQLIQELKDENSKIKHSIEENKEAIHELTKNINEILDTKNDKKTTIISCVIAAAALIVACIQFFI